MARFCRAFFSLAAGLVEVEQMVAEQADFAPLLYFAAERLGDDPEKWARFVQRLPEPVRRRLAEEFFAWQAHGGQREPAGAWRVWLIMAGRGFGKTRAGAEWISARAREVPGAEIALVGGSRDEIVKVMIEGPSGLLAVARSGERVRWRPTRGVVEFEQGARAFLYSAAAPGQLRGPEHHFAWCDELAKWKRGEETWDNLQLGMRKGTRPRLIVTTTPRPCAALAKVRAMKGLVETGGTTAENAHLGAEFREWAIATYGATRFGRQELEGILFDEPAGALFTREMLEAARQSGGPRQELKRIVVGVDPPARAGGDACGIVVCGLAADDSIHVLADCSAAGLRPEGWAQAVARAAAEWGADRVVAEQNQGGDMVESVLRSVDAALPVKLVSASRGKAARAEPVAARMESGRVKLAGRFPALEDELAGLTLGGGYEPTTAAAGRSPDRADAFVWAATELMRPARVVRVSAL
jgi:phage terminase large subunit-like protein